MNSENQENYTRYFVRRVTKELLAKLVPDPQSHAKNDSAWGAIQDGASKIGVGIFDVLRAALFIKNPDTSLYPKSLKSSTFPNTYGFFIVSIYQGKVTVYTDPATKTIQAGAEIFLVADLVGLPLARVTGGVEKSMMDVVPGQISAASYAIDLWLDPGVSSWSNNPINSQGSTEEQKKQNDQRVGRFIQTFMSGRNDLTIDDFCESAKLQLNQIINRTITLSRLAKQETIEIAKSELQNNIVGLLGLSSVVHVRPGNRIYRHQITLDANTVEQSKIFTPTNLDAASRGDDGTLYWGCLGCKTENVFSNAFCEECGASRPSGVKEGGQQDRHLLSSDGDQLVFDLNFASYDQPHVNYDSVAIKCLEILRPFCRKLPTASIAEPVNLSNIANLLDREFGTGAFGPLGEFSIIDVKSADSDWQLQTRSKIKEQLRVIDSGQAEMEVDMALYALRKAQLLSKQKFIDIEIGNHQLDAKKEIDIERIGRDAERERRKLDQEDFQETVALGRSDQLSQVDHEMGLEKTVLRHDINKEQILDDAKRIKLDKDLDFEDKSARLRATRNLDITKQEQDLEHRKNQQAHDNQLQKLQMMAELERQQKEQYRGLSPGQILAMQATGLAQSGAASALDKLAGADAEKERQFSDEKTKLYERMLDVQSKAFSSSEKNQIEIMKANLESQKDSTEKVLKAHEKSVENSQKWNEKSIDAMSKVATAVANKSGKLESKTRDDSLTQVVCIECGAQVDKNARFCGACGNPVQA